MAKCWGERASSEMEIIPFLTMGVQKIFSSKLLGSSNWANNQISMRQINRRCSKFTTDVHVGLHDTRRCTGHLKFICHFWTKEKRSGVSKGTQVNEKEQTSGKQILDGPPRNSKIQREI